MRLDLRLSTLPEFRELLPDARKRLWHKVFWKHTSLLRVLVFAAGLLAGLAVFFYTTFALCISEDGFVNGWAAALALLVFALFYWIGCAWVFAPLWPRLIEEARSEKARGADSATATSLISLG